jgi:solute carrier family 24 (sodium/potassium/calcium exchanger), member 6
MTFKRTEDEESFLGKCWNLVEIPLNFLRDFTIPMGDKAEWDRNRAAIVPFFVPWAALFLNGMFTVHDDSVDSDQVEREAEIQQRLNCIYGASCLMIIVLPFSIYVRMCTKMT